MTVVAIRDGVLAVDSLVSLGSMKCGYMKKFREVPEHLGGGYIACTGSAEGSVEVMDEFCRHGGYLAKLDGREVDALHLRSDGVVLASEYGAWIELTGNFFAVGSGALVAMGAMEYGATALEAAVIACKVMTDCGGEVFDLSINDQ